MVMKEELTTNYQVCTRCIMDTSDPDIAFDENGVCIHCMNYDQRIRHELHLDKEGQKKLGTLVEKIKEAGKHKDYDCIIGLSGGVDSTMVAYTVKKLGLRPLAVHLDNGWDSELAVSNVEKIVKELDIDLYTRVLDWEQFRDLHLSFLKASVINSEIPTDHVIVATLYRTAAREGIPYIFSGGNLATEAIMPESWGYEPRDWKHIKAIHGRFSTQKLKSFPHLTLFHWAYYTFVKGIRFIPILNYIDYNVESAKILLAEELGWRDYGGKHYESIYTRFFQGFILPQKFNIDKRRAHLSTLVNSGQLTRDEALEEMEKDPYSRDLLTEDREFVIKKLGLSQADFEEIMARPPRSFKDYPNNHFWFTKLGFFVNLAKKRATHN